MPRVNTYEYVLAQSVVDVAGQPVRRSRTDSPVWESFSVRVERFARQVSKTCSTCRSASARRRRDGSGKSAVENCTKSSASQSSGVLPAQNARKERHN